MKKDNTQGHGIIELPVVCILHRMKTYKCGKASLKYEQKLHMATEIILNITKRSVYTWDGKVHLNL